VGAGGPGDCLPAFSILGDWLTPTRQLVTLADELPWRYSLNIHQRIADSRAAGRPAEKVQKALEDVSARFRRRARKV
jgi:hypothetical protein